MSDLDEIPTGVEAGKDEEADELADQIAEARRLRAQSTNRVWALGGPRKDIAIRVLVQCFASMTESFPRDGAEPDAQGRFRAEDLVHTKLLDAAKQVVKVKRTLLKNENFDTRDFTIFIAQKKWIPNVLCPLLELCSKDDSNLAMNCCSLVLVLIRGLSDAALKELDPSTHRKRKSKTKAIAASNEGEDGVNNEASDEDQMDEELPEEQIEEDRNKARFNAVEQLTAILAFKEALCTEKCNEAVINAFREFWLVEQEISTADTKLGVAICLSYFRRLLAVQPHPSRSSSADILSHRRVHDRYIYQLRAILAIIPGICSDLRNSYHDDWLNDVLHIIFYILQNFGAEQLLEVQKKSTLPRLSLDSLIDPAHFSSLLHALHSETQNRGQNIALPGMRGASLTQQLAKEQQQLKEKLFARASVSRFGRFAGTFRVACSNDQPQPQRHLNNPFLPSHDEMAVGASGEEVVDEPNDSGAVEGVKVILPQATLCRDPFRHTSEGIPQAKSKRNKRKLAHMKENVYLDIANAQAKQTTDGWRACIVTTALAEMLCTEACLKSLVRRVNEDLRRDELRIGPELELQYFVILTRLMNYHRLKLEHQYQQHQLHNAHESGNSWEPQVKNIIDAMDRMSFSRVIVAIERLTKSKSNQAHVPVLLYTQMISYLRIMSESSLEVHHEIALGALYRLFYTSVERMDPLPKLLHSWKSGVFSRQFNLAVLQLLHETLRTLETTKVLFETMGVTSEEMLKRAKQSKKQQRELDLETYRMACWRFSLDEYIKKLINSQSSISFLVFTLRDVRINSIADNYMLYSMLRRLMEYKIEDESSLQMLPHLAISKQQSMHLGYLFFTVSTMMVLEDILADESLASDPSLQSLLSLLRQLVRDFAHLSRHNHLMFVEALFPAPRPVEHAANLHEVYEARSSAAALIMSSTEPGQLSMMTSEGDQMLMERRPSATADDSNSDEEEVFDENNVPLALRPSNVNTSKTGTSKAAKKPKPKESKKMWTAEEDQVLKKLYRLYAGSRSVFYSIAEHEEMRAFGKRRGEGQISRRVQELQLHLDLLRSDDDDEPRDQGEPDGEKQDDGDTLLWVELENEQEDFLEARSSALLKKQSNPKPRGKLQKASKNASSDDESLLISDEGDLDRQTPESDNQLRLTSLSSDDDY